MNLRNMLLKKGIFVHYRGGINGHNRSEVLLWRSVLDQTLKDATNEDPEHAREAIEWISASAGSPVRGITEEDGSIFYIKPFEELSEVCSRANIEVSYVKKTWKDIYTRIKEE